jgi:hypothetical protein
MTKPINLNFFVQAYRKHHWSPWYPDSAWATVDEAVTAATKLATQWKRKVRVVNQDEQVVFRMNGEKT